MNTHIFQRCFRSSPPVLLILDLIIDLAPLAKSIFSRVAYTVVMKLEGNEQEKFIPFINKLYDMDSKAHHAVS